MTGTVQVFLETKQGPGFESERGGSVYSSNNKIIDYFSIQALYILVYLCLLCFSPENKNIALSTTQVYCLCLHWSLSGVGSRKENFTTGLFKKNAG